MIPTIIIASLTFIGVTLSILFFPKIRIGKLHLSTYWIISLIGAIILLSFQLAPITEVYKELTNSSSVNPLKIIVLFFSMTILSIFLDEVGLFKFLASLAARKAKNNQAALFTIFYILTAVLTIFTSNDIVILTFTPFICFFCKNAKVSPIPYLVAEFCAANTWSLMLIIGNPTNIYLATSNKINFFDYFKVMALPTVAAGLLEYVILFIIFHHKINAPINVVDEEVHIENRVALFIGLVHLLTCLIFLIISSHVGFEMWLISLICAGSLLVCAIIMCLITKNNWNYITGSVKKLPYPLIPFFLSMFVIVVAINYQGISHILSDALNQTNAIWAYGFSSFLTSNLINNIPMSILFSNMCTNKEAVYASIVGSNIGAFLTPTGALAGIMFINLVNSHGIKYSFIDFIKYGIVVSLPVIGMTLFILFFTITL